MWRSATTRWKRSSRTFSGSIDDHLGQLLVQRYLKVYPMGETALVQVFMDMVERQKAQLKGDLMDWFKTQTWKPFSAIVGWQDRDEWDDIKLASFGQVEMHDPKDGILGRFGRLSMAVRVTASVRAKRKAAITDAPFSSMSDQELNSLIAKWENDAPENFWMDGELRATRPQAYAMYRDEWRKKSPREQTRLLQDLQQGRMATEFKSKAELEKYLKDHPGADKSKHTVKENSKPGKKEEPAPVLSPKAQRARSVLKGVGEMFSGAQGESFGRVLSALGENKHPDEKDIKAAYSAAKDESTKLWRQQSELKGPSNSQGSADFRRRKLQMLDEQIGTFVRVMSALDDLREAPMVPQKKKANNVPLLSELLSVLRAMHWLHWTAHWQAAGTAFYADHELFARLYGGLVDEIDGLAEKIVASYGADAVDAVSQVDLAHRVLTRWYEDSNPLSRAWTAEQTLQVAIGGVLSALGKEGKLSTGLENFLQGLADAHETNIYLLTRRMTPEGRVAARVAARYLAADAGDMSAPLDVGTAKGSKAWIALLQGYILVEEAGSPKRKAVMDEAVREVNYAAWLFRNKAIGKWLKEEAKKLGNLLDTVD